ncbi:YwaF family protein [Streptococcus dentapri]|uniref:TIGR02206 family membrane protein n=1 Tax=Streptococcus dentapri TaxID=573564 RepID=A0ABV8D3Q5_9STRE
MKEFLADFLTTQQSQPPTITAGWYALILLMIAILVWLTYRYHRYAIYVGIFKWLQIGQLLLLYSWYLIYQIPLSVSLPLYHCRLAMIGLIILPDKLSLKHYLALMGFGGALFALGYPVMDPYTFPHITGLSFIVGHFALLVNSLLYLFNHFEERRLSLFKILTYTFLLDLFLLWINHVTGGNYGIMRFTPIINSRDVWVNYWVVSLVLSLALVLIEIIFRSYKKP